MASKNHRSNQTTHKRSKPVEKKGRKKENALKDILEIILPAIGLFLIIHTFIAEARYVPSESMVPTIEIGDRFLVEKVSYYLRSPSRGDIVVFKPTTEAKRLAGQQNVRLDDFIKRIIGLPGDIVAVHDGKVFINGKILDEPYIDDSRRPIYEYGPRKVPTDHYLVLGDNRNRSWDGHYWGYVPRKNIIGRAMWRFWPVDRISIIR
jgi:signal peptidase I